MPIATRGFCEAGAKGVCGSAGTRASTVSRIGIAPAKRTARVLATYAATFTQGAFIGAVTRVVCFSVRPSCKPETCIFTLARARRRFNSGRARARRITNETRVPAICRPKGGVSARGEAPSATAQKAEARSGTTPQALGTSKTENAEVLAKPGETKTTPPDVCRAEASGLSGLGAGSWGRTVRGRFSLGARTGFREKRARESFRRARALIARRRGGEPPVWRAPQRRAPDCVAPPTSAVSVSAKLTKVSAGKGGRQPSRKRARVATAAGSDAAQPPGGAVRAAISTTSRAKRTEQVCIARVPNADAGVCKGVLGLGFTTFCRAGEAGVSETARSKTGMVPTDGRFTARRVRADPKLSPAPETPSGVKEREEETEVASAGVVV